MTDVTILNIAKCIKLLIDKAPPGMFPRELSKNQIEAAIKFLKNSNQKFTTPLQLKIFSEIWDLDYYGSHTPKLMFWNPGGMDEKELGAVPNFFVDETTGGSKEIGNKVNYGIGGKMTTLAAKSDLVFLSKKDGVIRMIMVSLNDQTGTVKILEQKDDAGNTTDIGDYTEYFRKNPKLAEKYSMDVEYDCTLVVMPGKGKQGVKRNTFEEPFAPGQKKKKHWLTEYLLTRFWSLPESIQFYVSKTVHNMGKSSGGMELRLMPQIIEDAKQRAMASKQDDKDESFEVPVGNGDSIIFGYSATNESSSKKDTFLRGTREMPNEFCGVIFKDEIFAVKNHKSGAMTTFLKKIGCRGGFKNFYIFYKVSSEKYEMTLDRKEIYNLHDADMVAVTLDDFEQVIKEKRPQRFIDLLKAKEATAQVQADKDLKERKGDFYDKMQKTHKTFVVDPSTKPGVGVKNAEGWIIKQGKKTTNPNPDPDPNPNPTPREPKNPVNLKVLEGIGSNKLSTKMARIKKRDLPEIKILETRQDAQEQDLIVGNESWFADFVFEDNIIYINPFCETVTKIIGMVVAKNKAEFDIVQDEEILRQQIAKVIVEEKIYDVVLWGVNNHKKDEMKKLDKLSWTIIAGGVEPIMKRIESACIEKKNAVETNTVNQDVVVNGEDARDTESESELTPEEKVRLQANGVVFPTKQ